MNCSAPLPASPLSALTVAALSLPAFSAPQPAEPILSAGVSNYREADIPPHLVVGGDNRRYDIGIRQFRLLTPVGGDWSLDLGVSREAMSGASPWATVGGPDGAPDLIMSGATIDDERTEVNFTATHHRRGGSAGVTLTRSTENDYEANALSVSGEWTFNSDLTTLSAGASHSGDRIEPTDAAIFGRVTREDRRTRSATVGLAQVLNRISAVYAGLGVTAHEGYLSDPYKLRDVRPRRRLEWALSTRYRHFLSRLDAALHVDYRHYRDDWDIASHTLHTSWHQNLRGDYRIVPNLRYYSQSQAEFFLSIDDFSLPADVSQSSDFRLSAYGAWTFGLKGILQRPRWSVTLSADRYVGGAKYGLEPGSGSEHPARLEFTLASVVVDIRF